MQEMLRKAAAAAADDAVFRRKTRRLVLICLYDYLVGLIIIGFSFHLSKGDMAPVLFYLGLLRAFGVPFFTVLLSLWLEENG